jgi:hypothetical protein
MAADRGVSLPIAALGVIALFLSTTFLGPSAFDLLRTGESDADKRPQLSQPPVESRLWEDPFAALVRHRAKLKELCSAAAGGQAVDPRCTRGERTAQAFRDEFTPGAANLTVLAAMVPGAQFVGVEEARRRVRYAVLAGLQAEGFVPQDSEHMGLLRVRPCEKFSGCGVDTDRPRTALQWMTVTVQRLLPPAAPKLDILYETFTARAGTTRVVVLWIDDSALGPRWLSMLGILLNGVAPDGSAVRVLGPYKSDDLVRGLDDLADLARDARSMHPWDRRLMVEALGRLRLVSPFSTAPAEQLREAARPLVV